MSLTKLLSGRKRGSVWWEFFSYDEGCEKSTCLVVNDATVCERKEPTVVHIPDSEDASTSSSLSPLTSPTSLQRFKFLANKIISSRVTTASGSERDTVHTQLNNYIADIMEDEIKDAMKFWEQRLTRYSKLNEFAQDLLSAPASQAYVERIFSLCGFLTAGRRNRMEQSLEMRAFLKLNSFL